MNKLLFSMCILGLSGGMQLWADYGQVDINMHVPIYFGVASAEGDAEVLDIAEYAYLVPEIQAHYFLDFTVLKLGIGARLYTLISQTYVFPSVALEAQLGPIVLNAGLAGGATMAFGVAETGFSAVELWLPQLSAAFQFSPWFQAGMAATGTFFREDYIENEIVPFTISAFARFRLGGPAQTAVSNETVYE